MVNKEPSFSCNLDDLPSQTDFVAEKVCTMYLYLWAPLYSIYSHVVYHVHSISV